MFLHCLIQHVIVLILQSINYKVSYCNLFTLAISNGELMNCKSR